MKNSNYMETTVKLKYSLAEQIEYYRKESFVPGESDEELSSENETVIDLDKFFEILETQYPKTDDCLKTELFYRFAQTPDEITSYAKHLISCAKKISPKEEILLFYFLQTAICYSVKFSKEDECNLEHLVLLAILLRDDTTKAGVTDTLFDFIIKDDFIKSSGDNSLLALKLYYERFCKSKTKNASAIIFKKLIEIAENYKPYSAN